MTLRWRLTLFYTGLLAALLAALALTTQVIMGNNLIGSADRDLRGTYSELVGDLAQPGPVEAENSKYYNYAIQVEPIPSFPDDPTGLYGQLEAAQTAAQRQALFDYVRVWRAAGRTVRRVDPGAPIELSEAEFERLLRAPDGELILNRAVQEPIPDQPTPMRLLVRLAPLTKPGAVDGLPPEEVLSVVYVGRSLSEITSTLNNLRTVNLALLLLGVLTAGTGAYLLAGQALYPLRRVQRAAERIGGQNLAERVPEPHTGDEVQALAHALNGMLGRLEASFEAQRRFTSDASHELRTPVTAIKGHAGYLLRRTNPSEGQRESLHIIQSESERLTNLIASLLELARSDSGALTLQRAPILSTLFLTEIARELDPLAQAQQTTLKVSGPEVPFEGDPARLKQVMINLVSNALKAGAATITLHSALAPQAGQVLLSVQDDGPGIPREQLQRLFDRFYRLEDSRSRDQGGAGLGLSIARGIVDAHGGQIWLDSQPGLGTTAHVQLPIGDVPVLDDEDVP